MEGPHAWSIGHTVSSLCWVSVPAAQMLHGRKMPEASVLLLCCNDVACIPAVAVCLEAVLLYVCVLMKNIHEPLESGWFDDDLTSHLDVA